MKSFFQAGQTVLFQGDSVTDCGRNREDAYSLSGGYPGRVAGIYNTLFPNNGVTFYNRGVSGNRSCDLLTRYEADFKALKPDFLSILIGINDVWRRYDQNDPTTAEQYEANYRTLLTMVKKDFPDTKIMIIEPFLLRTMEEKFCWREELDAKIQVARNLAVEFADYCLPLDGILNSLCVKRYMPVQLSADGVHPTDVGHGVIANAYLKALDII